MMSMWMILMKTRGPRASTGIKPARVGDRELMRVSVVGILRLEVGTWVVMNKEWTLRGPLCVGNQKSKTVNHILVDSLKLILLWILVCGHPQKSWTKIGKWSLFCLQGDWKERGAETNLTKT